MIFITILFILLLIIGTLYKFKKMSFIKQHHDRLLVVCTTSMITDAVSQIGGKHVIVKGLMGPGVDPHLYKAREGDMHTLASANIIFYNGLHLEGKMANIFEKMKTRTATVAVTDFIERTKLKPTSIQGLYDPHVWFDVQLWMTVVRGISTTLVTIDPSHAQEYEQNTQNYLVQLEQLDHFIRQCIEKIPPHQRMLITAHDAFGYFGQAYGFKVLGLQGISTETEANTHDVQELANVIATNRIKAIFAETSIPTRNLIAVANAAQALGWSVILGPSLYSDALGSTNRPEGTYIGMVQFNINAIVSALS